MNLVDENKEQVKFIRQGVIIDLILEMLYRNIELDSKNKLKFDAYNFNDSELLFLLEQYDSEKFNAIKQMLINTNNKED